MGNEGLVLDVESKMVKYSAVLPETKDLAESIIKYLAGESLEYKTTTDIQKFLPR